jgi:mono/diheme cytochrome c family protein
MPLRRPRLHGALALGVLVFSAGCDRAPSPSQAREWAPSDHDQELSGSPNGQQAAPPPKLADGGSAGPGPSTVEIAWQQACASCHGLGGHGDGPSGPMVNAPDLTKPELQDKYTDDDLANVIANGKNRMPKFDLSPPVVKGLVAKVRSLRGR